MKGEPHEVQSAADSVVLASTYRITAVVFRMSAEAIFKDFQDRGENIQRNIRAIPFYYLMSHATELFLKCVLLKRNYSEATIRKSFIRHDLSKLLEEAIKLGIPISEDSMFVINILSDQHQKHLLRYTYLLDNGELIYTPDPQSLFLMLDELLMMGRISTYEV